MTEYHESADRLDTPVDRRGASNAKARRWLVDAGERRITVIRNAVNQLRVLGRWMRMLTIPNQSSVAKTYEQFDENGRMKPSSYYDRIVDVMEELVKFTLLTRGISDQLTNRYSERKEDAEKLARRVKLSAI